MTNKNWHNKHEQFLQNGGEDDPDNEAMKMEEENKQFMILNDVGNPIPRPNGAEANPYRYCLLRDAFKDAEKELKNFSMVSVVEIKIVETFGREDN